jgi:hypothetical protein
MRFRIKHCSAKREGKFAWKITVTVHVVKSWKEYAKMKTVLL